MKAINKALIALLGLITFLSSCGQANDSEENDTTTTSETTAAFGDYTFGETKTYKNLQIFPVMAKTSLDYKNYMTLSNALSEKYVEVHETSNVNELAITNSSEKFIYLASGDIVKGGKQDRTMQFDVIVPPNTKDMPLASFCVEQGRWQKRGAETVSGFAASEKMVSSKKLRIAARNKGSQGEVWSNVATEQDKLSMNMTKMYDKDVSVKDAVSGSSLQLSLENEDLAATIEEYKKSLGGALDDENVVGFFYAVNGEVYGGDVYNNQKLFNDLKDKHFEAMVTEAVAEINTEKESDKYTGQVGDQMPKSDMKSEKKEQDVNTETKAISDLYKSLKLVINSTADRREDDVWLHKNYLFDEEFSKEVQPSEGNGIYRQQNSNDIQIQRQY